MNQTIVHWQGFPYWIVDVWSSVISGRRNWCRITIWVVYHLQMHSGRITETKASFRMSGRPNCYGECFQSCASAYELHCRQSNRNLPFWWKNVNRFSIYGSLDLFQTASARWWMRQLNISHLLRGTKHFWEFQVGGINQRKRFIREGYWLSTLSQS